MVGVGVGSIVSTAEQCVQVLDCLTNCMEIVAQAQKALEGDYVTSSTLYPFIVVAIPAGINEVTVKHPKAKTFKDDLMVAIQSRINFFSICSF